MTTTTTTTTFGLTKDDMVALRSADSIVFRSYPRPDGRVSQIRAIRNRRTYDGSPIVFTAREQRLFTTPVDGDPTERVRAIPVAVTWTFHTDQRNERAEAATRFDREEAVAFSMIHSSQFDSIWKTVTSLLRVGDQLILGWVANNDNGYTRKANLVRDELHLTIHRGDDRLRFLLAVSVCERNSARMVKPQGY